VVVGVRRARLNISEYADFELTYS